MSVGQAPSVGRIVHYVSYGTPGGEFKSECRAAIIAAVLPHDANTVVECDLVVLNPQGLFFNRAPFHAGGETPGAPGCPDRESHGNPFRYCACGWREAAYPGGTWHWPERVP